MAKSTDDLRERLSRYRLITISVKGRKSGRMISVPIWFVVESDRLYLLPVHGSETQWYQNILKTPKVDIDARGAQAELKVAPITESAQVAAVVEKFRAKYGAADVKKYYSKFDVAVSATLL